MLPLYILLTALSAQFFYILVNWFYFRRKEYLYYSLYIAIVTLYFLNKYLGDESGIIHIADVAFSKLFPDRALAVLSYIFYFKFGRRFIEAKTRYPSIDRLMSRAEIILLFYVIVDLIILIFTPYASVANAIFLPVNISIFIVLIFVFRAMIRRNEALDRFILTGSMFYAVSAFLTLWLGRNKSALYNDHILALQIGALVEMIFLNAGLVYKSRMLQNETINSQKQLIERYEENQGLLLRIGNIREQISRDLHDNVGASLSSIKVYSEILKADPKNLLIAELISTNSSEMMESLEVIAWSTNPEHDNLISLKNRMQKFAAALCHAKNIEFTIESNVKDEQLQIPGETRQHIFMIFKEGINNMVKYAEATVCTISILINRHDFFFQIKDNGKGFNEPTLVKGNGLVNMQKRATELSGNLFIESGMGNGTLISLKLDYPFSTINPIAAS